MRQPPAFISAKLYQPKLDLPVRCNTLADVFAKHVRPTLILQKAPIRGKDRVYLVDQSNGVSGVYQWC